MSKDNNKTDEHKVTLKSQGVEITPDKFIGITQDEEERDFFTTGNFTLSELKYIRHSFLDFIEEMMLSKLEGQRVAFKEVQNKREQLEEELHFDLHGNKGEIFRKCFAKDDGFEKVFDSRDLSEEMQGEVQEFVADLLSDVPKEDIEAMERQSKKKKKEENMNENVVNLAEYKG